MLVLVLVLVLDSKRIPRSAACTSGNFEIGTGLHFGQPYQPFEHEPGLVAAMPRCDLAVNLVWSPFFLCGFASLREIFLRYDRPSNLR